MKTSRLIFILDWLLAFILMAASATLAHYYFTWDEKPLKTLEETHLLYKQYTPRWLKPDLTTTTAQWETTIPLNEFDQMVFNTALARWNLQPSAPHAYPRLLEAYRSGLWNDAFTTQLTSKIEDLIRRWTTARSNFVRSGASQPQPRRTISKDIGFSIEFPPGTPSTHLGSLLEISFVAQPGSEPQTVVDVFWTTQNHLDPSPQRTQTLPLIEGQPGTDGRKSYMVKLDLSNNAEWLSLGTQAGWFMVHTTQGVVKWDAASIRYGDSPNLPSNLSTRR